MLSDGVASWTPGELPEALEGRADALLYQAKHEGRDRIVASSALDRSASR